MKPPAATHILLHPILIEKRDPATGEVSEEELKPAGTVVVLRRPKAKDLLAFDKHLDAPQAATIDLVTRCSNLGETEVENLDADDLEELGNALDRMSAKYRPIGDRLSVPSSSAPEPSAPAK